MCDIACVCISQGYWKQHIQFEEKANRKMGEEGTKNTTNYCPSLQERGGEEEREGRRNKVGRVGGRRKRQEMGGTQSREKNLKDGGRWCTCIYCTHIMANLHAIVVSSFVFRASH